MSDCCTYETYNSENTVHLRERVMCRVIIKPMPGNREVKRNANSTKGLFQVILAEEDEKGAVKKGGKREVRAIDVPYERAATIANEINQQLLKVASENSDAEQARKRI